MADEDIEAVLKSLNLAAPPSDYKFYFANDMERFVENLRIPDNILILNREKLKEILGKIGKMEHYTSGGPGGQGRQHRKTGRRLRLNLGDFLQEIPPEYRERAINLFGDPKRLPDKITLVWQSEHREPKRNEEEVRENAINDLMVIFQPVEERYHATPPSYIREMIGRGRARRKEEKMSLKQKKEERRWRPDF